MSVELIASNIANIPFSDENPFGNTFYQDLHDQPFTTNDFEAPAEYSYSTAKSKEASYFSSAAYCQMHNGAVNLANWTCQSCKKVGKLTEVRVYAHPTTKTTFYTGFQASTNRIIVAFMGSAHIENWLFNIDFTLQNYPPCAAKGCKVHRGFYNAYLSVRTTLVSHLATLTKKHPSAKIQITGHSLGGALANHLLLDLQSQNFSLGEFYDSVTDESITYLNSSTPEMDLDGSDLLLSSSSLLDNKIDISFRNKIAYPHYTQGAPRIGNAALGAFLRNQNPEKPGATTTVFRVVNEKDPVVLLPPKLLGYSHASHEIYYYNNFKNYKQCSKTDMDDKTCSVQHHFTTLDDFKKRSTFHSHYFSYNLNRPSNEC